MNCIFEIRVPFWIFLAIIFSLNCKSRYINFAQIQLKGRSHMRPRMDFHLVLHGEYL